MILCDTGPIVAAAVRTDAYHRVCTEMFTDLRRAGHRLLLPMTVVAEVGYLLEQRVGPSVEAAFLDAVGDGDFEVVVAEPADFTRMAELVRRYGNLPLGTTDASVIAMAERLGLHRIATIDRRHFGVVRPRHVRTFELLPELR